MNIQSDINVTSQRDLVVIIIAGLIILFGYQPVKNFIAEILMKLYEFFIQKHAIE